RGYSKSLATGAVTAGGILGILIPPSIMLILYGPMAGVSVGKLFFGAMFPGLVLSALYITYISIRSFIQKDIAPPVPVEERRMPFLTLTIKLLVALVPTGILVLSVLGVIYLGIAPPSEAAGAGAFASVLLVIAYRRFSFAVLKKAATETLRTSGYIALLLTMAVAFVSVFIGVGGKGVVMQMLLAVPGGRWGTFAVVMIIIFFLGMFIDWIGIILLMVPIITPVAAALGFDPVWFGIMVCVNLQMAFMTPPVASGIFITKGMCKPEWEITMGDIIRGVYPFVGLVIVGLLLFSIYPQIVTWLPGQMIGR
ncbi:MAG: TRAP transporter large permease subunit, partial [Dehalococcoidia bacterium]